MCFRDFGSHSYQPPLLLIAPLMLLAGLVSPLTQDDGKPGLQSEKQRAVEATALTFWGLLMLMTCVRVPVPMGSSRLPEGDCSVNWNDWKHRQTTSEARQGPTHYSQHRHTHTHTQLMCRPLVTKFQGPFQHKVLVFKLLCVSEMNNMVQKMTASTDYP